MMKRTLFLLALASASLHAQVSFDRLLQTDREPNNWLTYSGGFSSQRHSSLTQINSRNVKRLELQWIFQARSLEKFETTPLVVDGVVARSRRRTISLPSTPRPARTFWVVLASPAPESRPCCGRINRGVAILGDTLFMGTIDAHLVAVDATSGRLVWDVAIAKPEAGYSVTVAPLVVKDKVIIGTAGGEYGIRGFIAAYDAKTGKEDWRFYTVPGPGEPGHDSWGGDSWKTGGGSIWVTGSYDLI